jgi:MoxR-like ATPase
MQKPLQEPWYIFTGKRLDDEEVMQQQPASDPLARLPDPPGWRDFRIPDRDKQRGRRFRASKQMIEMVNAALYLRRPLLVTGKPGTGKSSLAYAVAEELQLGPVLVWPINTRTTREQGLYSYDAIARLRDTQLYREHGHEMVLNIGDYLRLEALGTALLPAPYTPDESLPLPPRPRVLLIDEIDKGDIDLPNDLLHIFEEGQYEIPELKRYVAQQERLATRHRAGASKSKTQLQEAGKNQENGGKEGEELSQENLLQEKGVPVRTADEGRIAYIHDGIVRCDAFPLVVMTSNKERDFPPAFLRRCLQLEIAPPDATQLAEIVEMHLGKDMVGEV